MAATTNHRSAVLEVFREFFFRQEVPYGMAIVRIAISAVTLVVMSQRWPYVREFFSADGAPSPVALNYGFPDFIPLLPGTWAVVVYSLMMFFIFTLMIGWKTRFSAICVFILFTYFTLQDSLSTLTKHSVLTSHMFLLLSLSDCGGVWSVDRWQELKRLGLSGRMKFLWSGRVSEIWPQRLLQIFIAMVYLGAGVTKMQTSTYFTGDQMRFWLLTNVNHWNPLGEFLSMQPALLVPMCYIAIIWEVTFIFMVWKRGFRLLFLGVGALFHLLTTLTLGLYIFPLVCISLYCCYISADDVAWWQQRLIPPLKSGHTFSSLIARVASGLGRMIRPVGQLGSLGFVGLMLLICAGGLIGEQTLSASAKIVRSKPVLQPMPVEKARRMLTSDNVIEERDMVFSFDIGHHMLGGLVIETGQTFSAGSLIYAQTNLVPPHGDLYIQCALVTEQGLVLDSSEGIVTRESFRYTFNYFLPDSMSAGNYQFVLKLNNKEVARKTIAVTANSK